LASQPLTTELRDHREALGLVRFHLNQAASEPDFLDRISRDRTVSETVRTYAEALAVGLWSDERDRREASRKYVNEIRTAEEQEAKQVRNTRRGTALNLESWNMVKFPGQNEAAYQDALRKAEEASRLIVDNGSVLNTLGVAQYRAGLFREALATLARSSELNAGSMISDAIFEAMCQQKLGFSSKARLRLEEIRQKIKVGAVKLNTEDAQFYREAEEVLLDAAFPAYPFGQRYLILL
jgi:hypothetical protein